MASNKYILYKYFEAGGDVLTDVKIKRFHFGRALTKRMLYNSVVSGFNQKVYYIEDNNGLVQYMMCIGKCKKFPFLNEGDYILGPGWTRSDARGRSLLSKMLNFVAQDIRKSNPNANIYTAVREENIASTKGVLKGDFKRIGYVEKTPKLKIYSKVHLD